MTHPADPDPMTEEEQLLLDGCSLTGWRVVILCVGATKGVYLAPPGEQPLDELTIGELRRCPWLEVAAEMQELGIG